MSIFSSKKFLIPLVSVAGISTVAIGTGVGLGLNQQTNVAKNNDETNEEKTEINKPQNDDSASSKPTNISIEQFFKDLDEKSIVLKDKTNKNETYAFDINASKLELKNDKISLLEGYELELSLDSSKNTAANLNDGKLAVIVKASKKNKARSLRLTQAEELEEIENKNSKKIELTGFKQADRSLVSLLKGDEASLELLEVKDEKGSQEVYNTIETLNSKVETKAVTPRVAARSLSENVGSQENDPDSFLTTLLKKQSTYKQQEGMKKIENVSVEGKVFLNSITKEVSGGNKAIFHLISADQQNPLKLVKKTKDKKVEAVALIGEIKTTNLLATNIKLVPKNVDDNATKEYLTKLTTAENGFKKIEQQSDSINSATLEITEDKGQVRTTGTKWNLNVEPYVVTKIDDDKKQTDFSLVISFGSDKDASSFDLSNSYAKEALKAAGFSFNIYSIKLQDSSSNPPKGMDFLKTNKLENYFKLANFSTPVESSSLTSDGMVQTKMIENTNLTNPIKVKLSEQEINNESKSETFVVFASYSYSQTGSNKVLLTPSISLVNIPMTQKAA